MPQRKELENFVVEQFRSLQRLGFRGPFINRSKVLTILQWQNHHGMIEVHLDWHDFDAFVLTSENADSKPSYLQEFIQKKQIVVAPALVASSRHTSQNRTSEDMKARIQAYGQLTMASIDSGMLR